MIEGKGIQVAIVADSINVVGDRLTTFLWKYPRFIHSEVMTHRVFSRNAASSRAIPVSKVIQSIQEDPAIPIYWGVAQAGMQASKQLSPEQVEICKNEWLKGRNAAIACAESLIKSKLHKQITNRVLEPWMHMVTLVSCTNWGNFFNLRVHKDAQPEFLELARKSLIELTRATPTLKATGEWHLPFNDKDISQDTSLETRLKIVTARAARTSYKNFDGVINIEEDCVMHDRLALSGHWSPFEHAAQASDSHVLSGNFRGWKQYRKCFVNENNEKFDSATLISNLEKS